jgi:hypothetical protein
VYTTDHPSHKCPSGDSGKYFAWKKIWTQRKPADKTCRYCGVDDRITAVHGPRGGCHYADIIIPTAWGAFENEELRATVFAQFNVEFEFDEPERYVGWLLGGVGAHEYSRTLQVFLHVYMACESAV